MQGCCKQDFKGEDEAEAEEDLVEVADNWFATIALDQDTIHAIALIQRVYRASIARCLIMIQKIVLRW